MAIGQSRSQACLTHRELWRQSMASSGAKEMGSQQWYFTIYATKRNQVLMIRKLRTATPTKCHNPLLSAQIGANSEI